MILLDMIRSDFTSFFLIDAFDRDIVERVRVLQAPSEPRSG